jgi:hypothetical protein
MIKEKTPAMDIIARDICKYQVFGTPKLRKALSEFQTETGSNRATIIVAGREV